MNLSAFALQLQPVTHRKVRSVMRSNDDPIVTALVVVAEGGKKDWGLAEVRELLRELDSCEDLVGDWLAIRV
jgi:hypothetical protein